jgi:hypothetical protein
MFVPFDAVFHIAVLGAAQHNDVTCMNASEAVNVRDQEALRANHVFRNWSCPQYKGVNVFFFYTKCDNVSRFDVQQNAT